KQIDAVNRKSSSKEEVSRLNTSVSQQNEQLLKSNADTGVRLNELTAKMERLEAKLEDTNRRLSQLPQQIPDTQANPARLGASSGAGAAALPPTGNPSSPAGGPPDTAAVRAPAAGVHPSPGELYDTAYSDYTKGRYPLAIQGFQEYLTAYPNTDLSDNA